MRTAPRSLACLAAAWTGLTMMVHAQASECSDYFGRTGRVCSAAVDGTRALHPIAGLLVSGGNPVLGTANTLGGLGHFSLTARANAAHVVLPDVNYDGSTNTVPASDETFAPTPLLEVAAGIYGGMPSGLLAIDFLGSAQLLPTNQIDHLTVESGARRIGDVALGFGYGARVGLLRESGPVPGVSVSVMRRDIPRLAYGDLTDGDQYSYAVNLHATNLRVVASKQFAIVDVAAGLGWDKYTGDASVQFRDPVTSLVQPEIPFDLNQSRILAFLDAGLDLSTLKLLGEVGYQGAKDQKLSTDFEEFDTTKGKFFASFGLRVGF
jgi:hypothetical protein